MAPPPETSCAGVGVGAGVGAGVGVGVGVGVGAGVGVGSGVGVGVGVGVDSGSALTMDAGLPAGSWGVVLGAAYGADDEQHDYEPEPPSSVKFLFHSNLSFVCHFTTTFPAVNAGGGKN